MNESTRNTGECCQGSSTQKPVEQAREQQECTCQPEEAPHWSDGSIDTPSGRILRVKTTLTPRDHLGTWMVHWGIRRMRYKITPGLYAVGSPTQQSPVFVTANYKMSFDRLRSQLWGRHAWILVLDTKGVNVWCSAGKGTFGSEELMRRIQAVRLEEIVSHRTLILPQLSATGVSAHIVRKGNGWRVVFGPVRSEDLPRYLDAGMKATPQMRCVRFTLANRLVLIPLECVEWFKYLVLASVVFLLLSGFGTGGYSLERIQDVGLRSVLMLLIAYLAGAAFSPALLPWIPGRAFSVKGAWIGLAAVVVLIAYGLPGPGVFDNWLEAGGWLLLVPAISSFLAMNFTGASTYTSLSGVRREMRVAVPSQITATAAGIVVWVVGRFM
ncbi:MAG: acetyl-CoA synthase subunit gamma [bacterium]|nr:MAG: acetyl-CoA synthase subunit gamma [bacterium]